MQEEMDHMVFATSHIYRYHFFRIMDYLIWSTISLEFGLSKHPIGNRLNVSGEKYLLNNTILN